MINIRFIISTLLLIALGIAQPVFAGEYKVLVIPNSCIDSTKKHTIDTVDIEELLSKKIINRMEDTGMACAPTIDILRISILNNPYYVQKAVNPINNAKIISNSYNVYKVILVSSKLEVISPVQQKEFWQKLNLPVISQHESNTQLVTTVTMYDMKSNQILWSDVYYQKVDQIGNNINKYNDNKTKLTAVNNYYDKLANNVLRDLSETTTTSAILVKSGSAVKTEPTVTKTLTPKSNESKITIAEKNITKKEVQKPIKEKQEGFLSRLNRNINNKYSEMKKSHEQKLAEKTKLQTTNVKASLSSKQSEKVNKTQSVFLPFMKPEMKKVAGKDIKSPVEKTANKKDVQKTVVKNTTEQNIRIKNTKQSSKIITTKKERPKQIVQQKVKKENKIITNTANVISTTKTKIKELFAKKTDKEQNKTVNKSVKQKDKTVKLSTQKETKQKTIAVKNVKPKEKKVSIGERIKTKYQSIKEAYLEKQENKIKNAEENYTHVITPITEDIPQVNSYIQTKPRNNARSFSPRFDSSINDI